MMTTTNPYPSDGSAGNIIASGIKKIPQCEPRTMFNPPSIEECKLFAAKIGLPDIESDLFFYFYESKSWHVGKSKMKVWRQSMQGWKLRWQERQQSRSTKDNAAFLILRHDELKRIEAKMADIKKRNGDSGWPYDVKVLWGSLIRRRDELRKVLDFIC